MDEDNADWREKANESPEYYLDSEAGRKELLEMIRSEADRLLQEVQKRFQPTKEIIWFSSHCVNCRYSTSPRRSENSTCIKWNCRLVRPFYGKPIWVNVVSSRGKDQLMISDIDWDDQALDVTNLIIEEAMDKINGGYPYPCFEPGK